MSIFILILLTFLCGSISNCSKENIAMEQNKKIHFTFRPVEQKDLDLIYQWFQQPHVRKWWPVPGSYKDFLHSFLEKLRKNNKSYLVFLGTTPIGYIQYYQVDRIEKWLPQLPEHTAGIDQFIGEPEYLHKGFGTLFIKQFIEFLSMQDKNLSTIIVDPEQINRVAIACYKKVGFKEIGRFRAPWGPALVMRFDIH
jgi:RimJ/RimL family protein N-acetyltransferase